MKGSAVAVGLLLVAIAGGAVALTAGSSNESVCGDVERLIEPGGFHVVPGAVVTYELSPPTSGPHQIPAPGGGVLTAPLAEPRQIAALEAGMVIVHHDGRLAADERIALEGLAGPDVIVTPAARPLDDDAAVAFTAWGVRQLCRGSDPDAAATFVEAHVGVFFVDHEPTSG